MRLRPGAVRETLRLLLKGRSLAQNREASTFEQLLEEDGGADRDRTGDPLLAKQVLSQLSYSPMEGWWAWVDSNYRPHPYQGCALTN